MRSEAGEEHQCFGWSRQQCNRLRRQGAMQQRGRVGRRRRKEPSSTLPDRRFSVVSRFHFERMIGKDSSDSSASELGTSIQAQVLPVFGSDVDKKETFDEPMVPRTISTRPVSSHNRTPGTGSDVGEPNCHGRPETEQFRQFST
jgi:hypothetical protein